MQRSTEQLTRCNSITSTEEVERNNGNVTATRTVSEKIMSVCRKAIRWMYLLDLAFALSVIVLFGIIEFNVVPHQQIGFFCNDPKISFKFTGDTITMSTLIVCTIAVPILVMLFVEYGCRSADRKRYKKASDGDDTRKQIWLWYGHYAVGIMALTLFCEIMKVLIGEPRPHFFDSCKPREAINCTDEYFSSYTCTNTELSDWLIKDSSKSFPSGHAALSVYMSIFLVWYLQCRLPNWTLFLKPWLQCLMGLWAVACSTTRVSDNRHHWWDVLAGDLLGLLFVLFTVAVPCRHFRPEDAVPDVVVVATSTSTSTSTRALDEPPTENGQIGGGDDCGVVGGVDRQRKYSAKKLLGPAIVDVSEGREMRDIVATWKK